MCKDFLTKKALYAHACTHTYIHIHIQDKYVHKFCYEEEIILIDDEEEQEAKRQRKRKALRELSREDAKRYVCI